MQCNHFYFTSLTLNTATLDPTEARETLGIWQAPTGDEKTQVGKLTEAVNKWCSGMQSRFLPSHEVEKAIRSTVGRKIHYCLIATNMTKAQCKEIIDPVVRRVMPRMKLGRNTCRTVVHAPTELLGVGIDEPSIVQLVEHVKELINIGGTRKHTGILLENVLEEHLIEAGLGGQITKWDMTWAADLMTDTWLRDTLVNMKQYDITINSHHPELTLWREKDAFIMDTVIRMMNGTGSYNIHQVKAINKCRKFLHVCTISDLCEGYGRYICKEAYDCEIPISCTSSTAYRWPKQATPTANEKEEWRAMLDNITRRGRHLRIELGKWKRDAALWNNWRYNSSHERMYRKERNGKWRIWAKQPSRTRRQKFQRTDRYAEDQEITDAEIPIVYGHSKLDWAIMHGTARIQTTEETDGSEISTRDALLKNGWAIKMPKIHNEQRIVEMLLEGTAKIVTDGSYINGQSSSGVIIFENDDDLYESGNYVPGARKDQTSYRSELGGLVNAVITVNTIAKRNNITYGACELGCDNDSALEIMFNDREPNCTQACYDLIRILRYQMRISPVQWKSKKVQGHQDKKKQYEQLDEWGKANVRVDKIAKKFMSAHPTNVGSTEIGGEGWSVKINGEPVTSNISKTLYKHCIEKDIKHYWAQKTYIDTEEYNIRDEVNWDAIEKFTTLIPGHQRRWITKHLAHNSTTGFVMGPARRKERDTDQCPMCQHIETSDHVIRCTSATATKYFDESVVTLTQWLEENGPWDLAEAFLEIILSVREEREVIINERWSDDVKRATILQEELSTRAFVSGFIKTEWTEIIEKHIQETKSKMLPITWTAITIKLIWEIQWTMWKERCTFLHNVEEARKKILAANIDENIDELYDNMPQNTWMTPAQRAIVSKPKRVVKSYRSRKKIRWYRSAKKMVESHKAYLQRMQSSASAQCMKQWLNPPSQEAQRIYHTRREARNLRNEEESEEENYNSNESTQQTITEWIKGNAHIQGTAEHKDTG